MRTAVALLFALLWWVATPPTPPAVAAPVPKAVKKTNDAELLQGRWESVSLDTGGGVRADNTWWVEIKDGKLTTGSGKTTGYMARSFKLDPEASPKHLDIDDLSGQFILTIYKLEDDTLTWCESSSTTQRPTEFKAGNSFNVFVFKRAKDK